VAYFVGIGFLFANADDLSSIFNTSVGMVVLVWRLPESWLVRKPTGKAKSPRPHITIKFTAAMIFASLH
jgi:hypothetical protein